MRGMWEVGDRLTHRHNPELGPGRVVSVDGRSVVVEFPAGGVRLRLAGDASAAASVQPSPEAEACRKAFAALLAAGTELAAVSGNLERLSLEYRRSVRRARALQDVMLPELEHSIGDIESRLEELEQEDAIWMRRGAGR